MKEILGIIAIVLTFTGYIPYIRDTLRHKTTPHAYSWFIWGIVTAIAFGLQVVNQGGFGSFVTLAAAIVCMFIFVLAVRQGKNNITKSDTVFLIMASVALILWLLAKQPVLSVILVTAIDLLGFIPTIRKSWSKPYEETMVSYFINFIRFSLATFALYQLNFLTGLYPVTMIAINGAFALFLIIRRRQMQHKTKR